MQRTDRIDRLGDLELALDATRAAGRLVMATFGTDPAVRHKGPDQPVTEADLGADDLLMERLLGSRPEYGWLSEETADRPERLSRSRVWVVDPIDGTRSFIAGYPEFVVSVGLVEAGEPVVGVIHNPASQELFWAVRGRGAFGNRGEAGGEYRLRVAAAEEDRPSLLASRSELGRGELEPFLDAYDLREMGSTAYKMAGVAAGAGNGFLSRGPKSEWDVAAGALIVEEAGGTVTDLRGLRLTFNRPDPYVHGVLVAAPALHAALLKRVRALVSPRLRELEPGD